MVTVLRATGLRGGYGGTEVLHGIDLHVDAGEVVVLLGANGAGKTTTLLALAGALPWTGEVALFGGAARGGVCSRTRAGLAFLPDARGVVRALTVEENLRLARVRREDAYRISPELAAMAKRSAGELSGGEQQILALTRALAGRPALLLADELSFGLAPIVVERMLGLVRAAAEAGAAVLVSEQFARQALGVADRAYVLRRGSVALEGNAGDLLADITTVEASYLGGSTAA